MFLRFIPKSGRARRLTLLTAALLLAALVAMPASGMALAQSRPPIPTTSPWSTGTGRWWSGRRRGDFVARPILSRQADVLFYGIRHPDTGDWITNTYRARGGEKQLSEGWEYTFEYPPPYQVRGRLWTSSPSCTPSRHTCWRWPSVGESWD